MAKLEIEGAKKRDLHMIPVDAIQADETNNQRFAPGDSSGIRASFIERLERGEHPQINPIVVKPSKDRTHMVVVSGYGRFREMTWLNKVHLGDNPERQILVKCTMFDGNDGDINLSNIEENVNRSADFSPMDIAFAVRTLTNVYDWDDSRIMKFFNKTSLGFVSQHRGLLTLHPEVQKRVHTREISLGEAIVLKGEAFEAQPIIVEQAEQEHGKHTADTVKKTIRTRQQRTVDEQIDNYIAKGNAPPKGTEQTNDEYRAEVAGMIKDDQQEANKPRLLRRSIKEVREFFENTSTKDKSIAAISQAMLKFMDGEIDDCYLYRVFSESCKANNDIKSRAA